MEHKENKWVRQTAIIIILIFLVWICVTALTFKLDREGCPYFCLLTFHIIFMIIMVCALIVIVRKGMVRDFGKYFNRKIVVYDPQTKKKTSITDDGTYVI